MTSPGSLAVSVEETATGAPRRAAPISDAPGRPEPPRRSRALAAAPMLVASLLLATVTAAVFGRQLFGGWTFPWDFQGKYTASPAYVADTIGRLHWTGWNPRVGGGMPAAVDLQAEMYNPLWWAAGLMHLALTLRVLTDVQVLHVWAGAVGMLALARARGLAWRWSVLAALPFVFFGGFYGNAQHADYFRGFAYAPWLLWSLTPPRQGPWWRLLALPPVTWLIAAGAYPAQLVAFAILGSVYLAVELAGRRPLRMRADLVPLALAAVAAVGVALAVTLPYAHALAADGLYRPLPVTAAARAQEAFQPHDIYGAYLNTFAWVPEGSVQTWAVGVPVLIGLAGLSAASLRRHRALWVMGLVALALAVFPAWEPGGQALLDIPLLFPSRTPAADYKVMIAVPLLILSAEGWRRLIERRGRGRHVAVLIGALVIIGIWTSSSHYAPVTQRPALIIAVTVLAVLTALVRWPVRAAGWAVVLVGALILADGGRLAADWVHEGGVAPWAVSAAGVQPEADRRDAGVANLPTVLASPPAQRSARTPPAIPIDQAVDGSNADTDGFVGLGYQLSDYGGTITSQRWTVEHDASLSALMLLPWTAWSWPCATVGCGSGSVTIPAGEAWPADPAITTTEYAESSITYQVRTSEPRLMVENELAVPGWGADRADVRPVTVDGALRGWVLPAGDYSFTASYTEPAGRLQELCIGVAGLTLIALVATLISVRRHRSGGGDGEDGPARSPASAGS